MSSRHSIRTDGLSWREVDGEIVILDVGRSKYLSLNGTGALLWKEMAAGADEERLVALLVERFSIDRDTAGRDVNSFLDRCSDLDLVQ